VRLSVSLERQRLDLTIYYCWAHFEKSVMLGHLFVSKAWCVKPMKPSPQNLARIDRILKKVD
jgi:hypothetical protein